MTAPHRASARRVFDVRTADLDRGLSVVEASAGTGKTFNIALAVIRLLLQRQADGQLVVDGIGQILVVTFTRAATEELVNRIRKVLRIGLAVCHAQPPAKDDEALTALLTSIVQKTDLQWATARLLQAQAELDTLAVFTLHGFCKRVLDEFALESGALFGATLVEDEKELQQRAMQDWWRHRFYAAPDLAELAVQSKSPLSPGEFLDDFRSWQNHADVAIEPALRLDGWRTQLWQALRRLADVWDGPSFTARATDMQWNKGAICATAEQCAAVSAKVEQCRTVDAHDHHGVLALATMLAGLSADSMHKNARKTGKANKAAADALREWPECQAATALAALTAQCQQVLRADALHFAAQWIAQEKIRRQALGFTDLLQVLHRVLMAQGSKGLLATAVRQQFRAALIDEFQDTDPVQFAIFSTLFADRPLILIGDPKQSIYGFRGADLTAYLDATDRADAGQRYTLDRNWRSSSTMLGAVNALFARRQHPFLLPGIAYPLALAGKTLEPEIPLPGGHHALEWQLLQPPADGGSPFFSKRHAVTLALAACVTGIVELLTAGWQPGQIAVLVRTGDEGRQVEERLRAVGVPAVVSAMGDITESTEFRELFALLQAIAAPRRSNLVRAAVATLLWGGDHATLQQMAVSSTDPAWETVVGEFERLRELWQRQGLALMLQQLLSLREVVARLLPLRDGDRRITNLRHAIEFVQQSTVRAHRGIEGVLRWMAVQQRRSVRKAETTELRLDTDDAAVQIVTVHKSKGLEYDIVFCPTLWNGRVTTEGPVLVSDGTRLVFDQGSAQLADRIRQANAARLAEDLRLLYVALTRARFRAYVAWGPVASQERSISASGERASKDEEEGAAGNSGRLQRNGAIHSALGYLLADDPALDGCAPADTPELSAQRLEATVSSWRASLEALVARHADQMVIRVVQAETWPARWTPTITGDARAVQARVLPTSPAPSSRFQTYGVSSFSHLTTGASVDAGGAIDRDDVSASATIGASVAPGDLVPSDFRRFPGGRAMGSLLHTLFETTPADEAPAAMRERVSALLQQRLVVATPDDPRVDGVVEMMQQVFASPLRFPGDECAPVVLHALPAARLRHEWEFLLPLADPQRVFTVARLSACFAEGDDLAHRYLPFLQTLPTRALHGFLTGKVDAVLEKEGRWSLIDWKSNQLGFDAGAYDQPALEQAMFESHYLLQAHLYVVALHRALKQRIPDYDFDRHIGGYAFAFLRGFVSGAAVAGHGWFARRPARAVIEALDALIGYHGGRAW